MYVALPRTRLGISMMDADADKQRCLGKVGTKTAHRSGAPNENIPLVQTT